MHMQGKTKLTTVAALALAGLMTVTGCTSKNDVATTPSASDTGSGAPAAKVKVAFVPKIAGIPYFEAMNEGGKEAAAKLGNVEWLYQGPTTADAAAQSDIARSFIQQKVNTLIVAPNDPDSMAPLLKEAAD